MTQDEQGRAAAPPGRQVRQGARAANAPSPLRRVAFWAAMFAVCYALSLFVLSEDWFLLAVPGIIGMVTFGGIASAAVVQSGFPDVVPYAADGTDRRGPVAYHRSALFKRYALLLGIVVVLIGLVVLVKSDYLIPLAPAAAMAFVFGTRTWIGALLTLSQCARVLKVYGFVFREPVKVLNRARGGGHLFRLGAGEHESEKLLGTPLGGGKDWHKKVSAGAWFAGDELFGGVLLVPGSGELVWVRPNDGPAVRPLQQAAAPERQESAAQAGIAPK